MKSMVIFVVVFAYISATEVAFQISSNQFVTLDVAISSMIAQFTNRLSTLDTCLSTALNVGGVGLSYNYNESIKESRKGYLIASNVVLSTAHSDVSTAYSSITTCLYNALVNMITDVVAHPNYNPETLENDISLMRLSNRFLSGFTKLPNPFMRFINYEGRTLTAVGWNSTSSSSNLQINHLKIGELLSKCSFGNYTNFICVSNDVNNGIASKKSDALFDGPRLVGIYSQTRGNFNVYTRVDRYLEWILSFIQIASNSTITV